MDGNVEKARSIQIKNLTLPEEIIEVDQTLNLETFLLERDKMLKEVEKEISMRKAALAAEIEETRQFVDNEIAVWEQQKVEFQQAAYDEGFTQGLEEGRNKATADMKQAVATANEAIGIAHENAMEYLQHQEHVILELAIRTSERILGTTLEENDELFLSIVKRGLKEAREMKEVKVYVSPTYFSLVSSNREELASIFPVDVPFMIFVDEDINPTDCYIETNHGRIVVSIDEQLQELRRKLVDTLDSME